MSHLPPQPDVTGLPVGLRSAVAGHWKSWCASQQADLHAASVFAALPTVWASSDWVARTCVQHPGLLHELIESGDLERRYAGGELAARLGALAIDLESESALHSMLRRVRRREALRIAWRDLAGWAALEEVMAVMSELADGCVHQALAFLHHLACAERGTPRDSNGSPVSLIVLALGKLGGRELNFSSDIDLIFAYRADGDTDISRSLSNHEFFAKLSTRLIHALDHISEDGRVFRVDMRLRPNGNSGPIAMSMDAMIQYYQVHGRDWERYALIKARTIAGDLAAGQALLEELRPFVYRKYLDFGAIQAIRDMKQIIDREVARKHGDGDIKLGCGGIREIEFLIQSLQLIRGGREPRLRTNRLHRALETLAMLGIVEDRTRTTLEFCYRFLRRLEHRLQMLADEQRHLLPRANPDRERVALAMGEPNWPDLARTLTGVRNQVHQHFQEILSEKPPPGDALNTMGDLWAARIERQAALPLLRGAGYQDPDPAFDLIRKLHASKSYHAHSKLGRERLDRLMPALIQLAGRGARPFETLSRLVRFVEAVGRRSAYLVLLTENPQAVEQLVRLCGTSAWVSNWIGRYPLLLEELLGPIVDTPDSFEAELIDEIEQRLRWLATDDVEAHMEAFREIHHAQVLRIAVADITGAIDRTQIARSLCAVAERLLAAVSGYCSRELGARIGAPQAASPDEPPGFAIVGYGKLGSRELGYNSDIDLVFMHQGCNPMDTTAGGRRSVSNEQYFVRLVQRITHMIATPTPSGVMYEIDHRLRPSGGSGPLVTSLAAFRDYQHERAWTWEHQALVRARAVCGPAALADGFEAVRREVICTLRDPDSLHAEVVRMRAKMRAANDRSADGRIDLKQCVGGIIDIEFIVQYYVLRYAHESPVLAGPRGTLELLAAMGQQSLLTPQDTAHLQDAYRRYLDVDHGHKLAEQASLIDATQLEDERRSVADIWNRVIQPPG